MITIRPSQQRGFFDHGWLKTYHTFSFNNFYDPQFMGYRSLRVINQDIIAPTAGFGMHSHHDMEILTYVLRGEVTHQDNLGHQGTISSGQIQLMSAGTGIRHSESNSSKTDQLELLQIWLIPNQIGIKPQYQEMSFQKLMPRKRLLVSPDGQQNSLIIHQNAKILDFGLQKNQQEQYVLKAGGHLWLQLITGKLLVQQEILLAGDGAAITQEPHITLKALDDCEFLLFDL